jgi:hypothetical protein
VRRLGRRGMLHSVISRSVNVSLSIERDSDPISGFVTADVDPEPREFSGWVELAGAIEEARLRHPGGAGAEILGWVPGASSNGGS